MNRILIGAIILLMSISSIADDKKKGDSEKGYKFTDTKEIPHSSVKSQYRSGTCWSFSAISFIEAEMMRNGKAETDLSEMFVVHHSYYDKSLKYVRMHGQLNYGGGGAFNDVTDVIKAYGMMPDTAYSGLNYGTDGHVHGEMDIILKSMVDAVIKNKNKELSPAWPNAIEGAISAYLGPIPEKFTYQGKEYTPRTFADNYMEINTDDYVFLTSFSHHPFYEEFAVEVPDNWSGEKSYNLPIEELMQVMDYSIENGYTVAWAADVSEKGFNWEKGVAVVPETDIENLSGLEQAKWENKSKKDIKKGLLTLDGPSKEKTITQEVRQTAFDNFQTTDDHGMHLIGTATDQNGTKYYKIKNSWGIDQKYEGYFYASEAYLMYKTMDILVHKNAIPKKLRKKLGIK